MLGLKQEHFSSDLHDGRRLHGHGDGEQGQLRSATCPVVPQQTLAVDVLQSPLELQSLVNKEMRCSFLFFSELTFNLQPLN